MNPLIELTEEPIDTAGLLTAAGSNQAGAVVLFLGTVREHTHGRQTVALDYEGHRELAEAELRRIVEQARQQFPIERVAVSHRLGHLELGEVSVAVAVSCPHRAEAFDAARFLIDRLKETVPIWKKENWSDGTTEWVHPGVDASAEGASTS